MATSSDKGDVRDLMQCSICMEPFKNPKDLPCFHTFCFECLAKYGKDKQPGDVMACPLCRQMFKIPAGGFKKLPNNIFIEQIAEGAKLFKAETPSSGVQCDGCKERNARTYCVECSASMCDECSVPHGNLKATRAHKVVSLAEMEGSSAVNGILGECSFFILIMVLSNFYITLPTLEVHGWSLLNKLLLCRCCEVAIDPSIGSTKLHGNRSKNYRYRYHYYR